MWVKKWILLKPMVSFINYNVQLKTAQRVSIVDVEKQHYIIPVTCMYKVDSFSCLLLVFYFSSIIKEKHGSPLLLWYYQHILLVFL